MIDTKKLCIETNEDIIRVITFVKESHSANVAAIQKACNIGYVRAARYLDLMENAGILARPKKYRMVLGEDQKRHREYLPYELAVSDEELQACIEKLNK